MGVKNVIGFKTGFSSKLQRYDKSALLDMYKMNICYKMLMWGTGMYEHILQMINVWTF